MQALFRSAHTVPWLQESDKSASAGFSPAEADVVLSVVALDLNEPDACRFRLVKILSSGNAQTAPLYRGTASRLLEAWRKKIYQEAFLTPGIWPL